MALPIEDYALIGDRGTAALVGRDGSIDWLCLPRFDSPACFAALLGDEDNGRWLLAPADEDVQVPRRYVDDTALLETTFTTKDGEVVLLDVMPTGDGRADVVRRLTCTRGTVRIRHDWVVRTDYGKVRPWVHAGSRRTARRSSSRWPVPTSSCCAGRGCPRGDDGHHSDEFDMTAGDAAHLLHDLGPLVARHPRAARLRRADRGHDRQQQRRVESCARPTDVPPRRHGPAQPAHPAA